MATTPLNSPVHAEERLANFYLRFPLCRALKIQPVAWGSQGADGGLHDGFDIEDVEMALGADGFALLMAGVTDVFCCGHRTWPSSHAETHKRGAEVHCIWASDLEAFLKAGH